MGRLLRWYNQNRKIIWVSLIIITGIIILVQALNNSAKNNVGVGVPDDPSMTYQPDDPDYSVITEEKIPESVATNVNNTIEQFMEYCNNKKIQEAYDILTNDCKELLFPTLQDFYTKYYNRVFEGKTKTYKVQSWINYKGTYTYLVQIKEDYLSSRKPICKWNARILYSC